MPEGRPGEPPPPCPITGLRDGRLLRRWIGAELLRLWKEDLDIDLAGILDEGQVVSLWQSGKSGLQFFHPIVTGDARLYRQLRRRHWYLQPDKWEFRAAARQIAPADRVLDLGAGDEPFRAFVAPEGYSAFDPFTEAAAAPEDRYDVVCAFQVLEHVADPLAFVAAAKERLGPGGRLLLGVPNRESYLAGLRDFPLDLPPHHVTRWSRQALEALAQAAGLQVETIESSPLETWEAPLYWMARVEDLLPQPARGRSRSARVCAFVAARALSALLPLPKSKSGGTLLLRARV